MSMIKSHVIHEALAKTYSEAENLSVDVIIIHVSLSQLKERLGVTNFARPPFGHGMTLISVVRF